MFSIVALNSIFEKNTEILDIKIKIKKVITIESIQVNLNPLLIIYFDL